MTPNNKLSKLAQEFTAEDARKFDEQFAKRTSGMYPGVPLVAKVLKNDFASEAKTPTADVVVKPGNTHDHTPFPPKVDDTALSLSHLENDTPSTQKTLTQNSKLADTSTGTNLAGRNHGLVVEQSRKRKKIAKLIQPGTTPSTRDVISNYFNTNSPAYKICNELRQTVQNNPKAFEYIDSQRRGTNPTDDNSGKAFFKKMQLIAGQLERMTSGLKIARVCSNDDPARILDLGTAPGGFLATALALAIDANQKVRVHAFTLPTSVGGVKEILPARYREFIEFNFVDITELTPDLSFDEFVEKRLDDDKPFDLVICDAKVLSPEQHKRSTYRDPESNPNLEADRLHASQLVLGLEHVRVGGTMIVFMNKLEDWRTLRAVADFSDLCEKLRLFKPATSDTELSSFYMVAKGIKAKDTEPYVRTLEFWKSICRESILRTDEESREVIRSAEQDTGRILEVYGKMLVNKGGPIWKIQADALGKEGWTK